MLHTPHHHGSMLPRQDRSSVTRYSFSKIPVVDFVSSERRLKDVGLLLHNVLNDMIDGLKCVYG